MRKILITGGAGFVGRRFVARFLESGDEVHCVDSLVPLSGAIAPDAGWFGFEPRDHSSFHFHQMDCREYFRKTHDTDFDYSFHLAAIVGGRLVIENNPLAVADDLSIDSAYWQWAIHTRPAKTVCFSSSAAYPIKYQSEENYQLLREEMIDFDSDIGMPDMSYGWAKLTVEYLAQLAYEKNGLNSVCYRPFSGYGEDQDFSYPFPSICKRALDNKGADSLEVWGTGEQKRDFIHIDDCVDGVLQTMDQIDDAEALNLSTGVYTSFIEFASLAAKLCEYEPKVTGISDKPTGVFARGGDTAKQEKLGFTYKVNLETGIKRSLEHYARERE
jgi:nucleoside-diphosphate-sugar epimerase